MYIFSALVLVLVLLYTLLVFLGNPNDSRLLIYFKNHYQAMTLIDTADNATKSL